MTLEKILSAPVLIGINIAIIVAAELSGDFFLDTGLIHIIAFLFLLLGLSRIFVHYKSFDKYLLPLTVGAVVALLLFAYSHLTEYMTFGTGGHGDEPYPDELYVDVTNLYMTGMLLVALGAQYFLARRDKSYVLLGIVSLTFIASSALTFLSAMRRITISLEPDEYSVYLYTVLFLGISALSINRVLRLGSAVSIVKSFSGYIAVAFGLILVSALYYLLYEILEELGMPLTQIIYISHFLFYAALSLMFLAFPKLARLGGLYDA